MYLFNCFNISSCIICTGRKKTNILYSIVVAIPLIIVSGIRWNVGTDFGTYYYTFNKILSFPFSILISNSYGDFIPFERGFSILVWIIGVISKEPQVVIFLLVYSM